MLVGRIDRRTAVYEADMLLIELPCLLSIKCGDYNCYFRTGLYNGIFQFMFLCSLLQNTKSFDEMSLVMRKPAFYIFKNKDADKLRGSPVADQRLCFHYTVQSLFFLNLKFQGSSHLL